MAFENEDDRARMLGLKEELERVLAVIPDDPLRARDELEVSINTIGDWLGLGEA